MAGAVRSSISGGFRPVMPHASSHTFWAYARSSRQSTRWRLWRKPGTIASRNSTGISRKALCLFWARDTARAYSSSTFIPIKPHRNTVALQGVLELDNPWFIDTTVAQKHVKSRHGQPLSSLWPLAGLYHTCQGSGACGNTASRIEVGRHSKGLQSYLHVKSV
jgi:hypothetical protein